MLTLLDAVAFRIILRTHSLSPHMAEGIRELSGPLL